MPRQLSNNPMAVYQREWRAKHKEQVAEYNRRAKAKFKRVMTPEQRRVHNEYQRVYANAKYQSDEKYRNRKKAYNRAYYMKNLEKCKAYQAEYRKLKKEMEQC